MSLDTQDPTRRDLPPTERARELRVAKNWCRTLATWATTKDQAPTTKRNRTSVRLELFVYTALADGAFCEQTRILFSLCFISSPVHKV